MGQRFQCHYIYNKTNENKEIETAKIAYYLQWSWGHYSISRLAQVLEYMDECLKYDYNPFNKRKNWILEEDGKNTLRALSSLNMANGSYVEAYEESNLIADIPTFGENNDGIFIVDLRKEEPRWALFGPGFQQMSPERYLEVDDSLDRFKGEHDDIINTVNQQVEFINKHEQIPEEELRVLYPEMYKIIDLEMTEEELWNEIKSKYEQNEEEK